VPGDGGPSEKRRGADFVVRTGGVYRIGQDTTCARLSSALTIGDDTAGVVNEGRAEIGKDGDSILRAGKAERARNRLAVERIASVCQAGSDLHTTSEAPLSP